MTDKLDYRLYLEEKFSGLNTHMNAQFGAVHDKLDSIEKQTTDTNSRVNHLEDDVVDLEKKVDGAIADGKHILDTRVVNCPNLKRFEKFENQLVDLETKLEDAMFFIRHPKLLVGSIVVLVIISILTLFENGLLDFVKSLIS